MEVLIKKRMIKNEFHAKNIFDETFEVFDEKY